MKFSVIGFTPFFDPSFRAPYSDTCIYIIALGQPLQEMQQGSELLTSTRATGSRQGNADTAIGYFSKYLRVAASSWTQHPQDVVDLSRAQTA